MIYFLEAADSDWIKIGTTFRLTERLKVLSKKTKRKLRVLAVMEGGFSVENAIHQRFSHLRGENEWFVRDDELMAFIEQEGKEWSGEDETPPVAVITIKGNVDWRAWLEEAAVHSRTNVSAFIDLATAHFAKHQGFTKKPPER